MISKKNFQCYNYWCLKNKQLMTPSFIYKGSKTITEKIYLTFFFFLQYDTIYSICFFLFTFYNQKWKRLLVKQFDVFISLPEPTFQTPDFKKHLLIKELSCVLFLRLNSRNYTVFALVIFINPVCCSYIISLRIFLCYTSFFNMTSHFFCELVIARKV